ncbi:MAG: hypothetical protein MRJ92_09975 [Nitrospira sp.]|nr:hypothetical protein [Nitrospira sp.]
MVWDKEAPGEWDFRTYNSDSARGKIYEWLKNQGAREITIPYRANRAVLFNSDLFHETDDIAFREGVYQPADQHHAAVRASASPLSSFSKSSAQTGRLNR